MLLNDILKQLQPYGATLVAVSKTQTIESILNLYHQGQRHFGENRVQELVEKYESTPKDINWHLIGQLQTNKVKYVAPFVSLIHSVDSLKLLVEINHRAAQNNRVLDCLLQIRIALEDTKSGMSSADLGEILSSDVFKNMKNIRIRGLMGMATHTDAADRIRYEFKQIKTLFDTLKKIYFQNEDSFDTLSMGMSDDFLIALQEGSTMVRIGSLLFRNSDKSPV